MDEEEDGPKVRVVPRVLLQFLRVRKCPMQSEQLA